MPALCWKSEIRNWRLEFSLVFSRRIAEQWGIKSEKMLRIGLVINKEKPKAVEVANEIITWAERKGLEILLPEEMASCLQDALKGKERCPWITPWFWVEDLAHAARKWLLSEFPYWE